MGPTEGYGFFHLLRICFHLMFDFNNVSTSYICSPTHYHQPHLGSQPLQTPMFKLASLHSAIITGFPHSWLHAYLRCWRLFTCLYEFICDVSWFTIRQVFLLVVLALTAFVKLSSSQLVLCLYFLEHQFVWLSLLFCSLF